MPGLQKISTVAKDDILLKAEDDQVYVIRFDGAAPTLLLLDGKARAEGSVAKAFDTGMILGVPRRAGDALDGTFRLDMNLAKSNVQTWLAGAPDAPRNLTPAAPADGDPGNAGPYDVVFGRRDATGRHVFVVQCTDYPANQPAEPGVPKSVVEAKDPASVEAVQSLFDTGVLLAFLQELTLPIGFTCYLLNTEKFWK
jgi:hypothetical protein